MNIKKILPKKSKRRFECNQSQDGKIVCQSFREHEDGTRSPLAEIQFEFDANCKGVATHMEEHEEGELDKLEKKSVSRLREKCKSIAEKPQDY